MGTIGMFAISVFVGIVMHAMGFTPTEMLCAVVGYVVGMVLVAILYEIEKKKWKRTSK